MEGIKKSDTQAIREIMSLNGNTYPADVKLKSSSSLPDLCGQIKNGIRISLVSMAAAASAQGEKQAILFSGWGLPVKFRIYIDGNCNKAQEFPRKCANQRNISLLIGDQQHPKFDFLLMVLWGGSSPLNVSCKNIVFRFSHSNQND